MCFILERLRGWLQLGVHVFRDTPGNFLFLVCNENSPEDIMKTKANVKSPRGSANGSLNWFLISF